MRKRLLSGVGSALLAAGLLLAGPALPAEAWSNVCTGPNDTSCLVQSGDAAGRQVVGTTWHAEGVVTVPYLSSSQCGSPALRAIWVATGRSDTHGGHFEQDGIAWSTSSNGWYAWYQLPYLMGPTLFPSSQLAISPGDRIKLWVRVGVSTNGGEVWFSVQNLTTGHNTPQVHLTNLGASNLTQDGAEWFEENNFSQGWTNFPGAPLGDVSWTGELINNQSYATDYNGRQWFMYDQYANPVMENSLGNTTTQTDYWIYCD